MSRIRTITPSQTLFVSSNATGTQTISQLYRLQSCNHSASVKRTPVTVYGQQAPLDQLILEPVEVSADFSYLITNALNEKNLGFNYDGTAQSISGFLTKATDERNYYFLTAPEGEDAVGGDGTAASNIVCGIGNGFITSYQVELAVGSFPTASLQVQGLNERYYSNSTGQPVPAINPVLGTLITGKTFTLPASVSGVVGQAAALRPGDVFFDLQNPILGVDLADAKIQNARISVDLSREPLNKLGSHFPFSREIQYPINITVSVEANVGDITTGSLSNILCNDSAYNLAFGIKRPACNNDGATVIRYDIKGAKWDSSNYTTQQGNSETVSLQWTAQIGGPRDLDKGLFISGVLN